MVKKTPLLPENRRIFRRAVCALLALLLLLSTFAFASCGDTSTTGEQSSASVDASADSGHAGTPDAPDDPADGVSGDGYKPPITLVYRAPEETVASLPDYQMDGALIIAVDERCGELLGEHPMLSASFDGVNAAIKARYGAEAFFQSYPSEEMLAKSKKAVAAGDDDTEGDFFADLLAIPLSELPVYLAADLLTPVDRLGGLSFLSSESSADTGNGILFADTRALSVDGRCYALLGSGALSGMGTTCLLFNHTLLDELLSGAENLYTAVKAGEWTWDRLLSLLSAAQAALDAAEISDASSAVTSDAAVTAAPEAFSLLGTTLSEDAFSAAVYKSFDTTLTEDAAAGSFYLSAVEAMQTLAQIKTLTGSDAKTAFREGELLFLVTTLDALYDYTDADGSWGCLPLPKRNEEAASYHSMLDPDGTYVYVALKNDRRTETKGNYLLASCATAERACLPTFVYELLSDYIREGAALDMIPYILAGAAAEKAFLAVEGDVFSRLTAAVAGETVAPEPSSDAAFATE